MATETVEVNAEQGSMDLKNTLELLKALGFLTEVTGEVLADGKVNLKDLKSVPKLLENYKLFVDAVKEVNLVGKELKDLSEAEMLILAKEVFVLLQTLKNAIKK